MAVKKISVMDPTARASIPEGNMAPRLEELDGKVAGFLDNGKPNADVLLARGEELLSGRCRLYQTVRRNKPVAAPSARSVMDELVRKCSFVVIGAGD